MPFSINTDFFFFFNICMSHVYVKATLHWVKQCTATPSLKNSNASGLLLFIVT